MSMVRKGLAFAAILMVAFAGYAWFVDNRGADDVDGTDGPLHQSGASVERGEYLAAAADCVACHTVAGQGDFAGGLEFRLPFGTIYSSNLTSDPVTGIGSWTDAEFLRAVRGGVGRGGRHLYPAHPYTSYSAMARNDVLAIRAYLASVPPISNQIPSGELRFPYSQRWLMPLWNALFLSNSRFQADGRHSETWNRGAYLATALGHCGECHTPRNFAYGLRNGRALTGAITQGWRAYDITAGVSALGSWTDAAVTEYLATGHAAGHGSATGPMKQVVAFSTGRLRPEDRSALVDYLVAGRSRTGAAIATATTAVDGAAVPGKLGARLYAGACAGCHPLDPSGGTGPYSNLTGASSVRDSQGTNVLRLLAVGSPHGIDTGAVMPDFGSGYTDTERAALANFVLAQWGHTSAGLTPNDARRARLLD